MTNFHKLHSEVRADRRRLAFKVLACGQSKQHVADFVEVNLATIYDWIKNNKKLEKNSYHGLKRGNPND